MLSTEAVRALALGLTLVLTLGCASSPTPEPRDDSPPPAQPAQVEGPAPATDPAATPAADGLCTAASYESWSDCEGKRMRVQGRKAEFVQQHPMLSQPEGLSPDGHNTFQGYMDTDAAQLIVLTNKPFDCPGKITVVGELQRVRGDGPAGTKESYSGWALSGADVTCE